MENPKKNILTISSLSSSFVVEMYGILHIIGAKMSWNIAKRFSMNFI